MVVKWSILNAALKCDVQKSNIIIAACMCLHNWCIDNKESIKTGLEEEEWREVYFDAVTEK